MVYIDPDVIWMVVVGFIVAFVLAIGVGANDVANTFGTSVGAKVLTLRQACIIASIVETLGAVLLGGKVTNTIRKGIIDVAPYENSTELLMAGNVATLTGSCVWLFIATIFKMPVSGTHSIVGATVGFALVAKGTSGIGWKQLGLIVSSWFISPVLSGAVSVGLFMLCKYCILNKKDPLEPGLRLLPIFYSCTIVVNLFSIFYEGPEMLYFDRIPLWGVLLLSFGTGILTAIAVRFFVVPWQREKILSRALRNKHKKQEEEALQANERERLIVEDEELKLKPHSAPKVTIVEESQPAYKLATDDAVFDEDDPSKIVLLQKNNNASNMDDRSLDVSAKNGGNGMVISATSSNEALTGADASPGRFRSKSISSSSPEPPDGRKRVRSKSESATEQEAKHRHRHFSGTIDDLHDRRFLPVDKSMALNIEKRAAQSEEAKLGKEGLGDEEIAKKTREAIEDRPEQHHLFSYLQILTAVFGGFAHGGNDVSNAIGPLVSIWLTATSINNEMATKAAAPMWILLYGGVGISIGLWIWGRRVIKTMGEDLAKITPSTGFCIELGAALTVLGASNLGLPISTTHCKVGSVVFVGWIRARKNVDWKLFGTIFLAWLLTLPVAGGISAAVMAGLKLLV